MSCRKQEEGDKEDTPDVRTRGVYTGVGFEGGSAGVIGVAGVLSMGA